MDALRTILNMILFTGVLPVGQIAAGCVTDQRAAKTSTEAVIAITLEQTEIKSGEAAKLHVKLTNASKHSLTITETSLEREFEIRVTDAHGKEPPLTEQGKNLRGPVEIYRNFQLTLAPGEVVKGDEDISQIYSLAVPGEYRATVCRVVVELGPILSNAVSLTVRPQ
jgi:hypothetical protein